MKAFCKRGVACLKSSVVSRRRRSLLCVLSADSCSCSTGPKRSSAGPRGRCRIRILWTVAEVDEGGVHVLVDGGTRGRRRGSRPLGQHELVAQLEADAVGGLLPDAGDGGELARVAARDGVGEISRIDAGKDLL